VSLLSGNDALATTAAAAAASCQSEWDSVWLSVHVHADTSDNQLCHAIRKYDASSNRVPY